MSLEDEYEVSNEHTGANQPKGKCLLSISIQYLKSYGSIPTMTPPQVDSRPLVDRGSTLADGRLKGDCGLFLGPTISKISIS